MVHTSAWHRLFTAQICNEYNNRKHTETSQENPNPKRWKRQKPLNTACGFEFLEHQWHLGDPFHLQLFPFAHPMRTELTARCFDVQLFGICLVVIMTQEQWWCHQTNQKIAACFSSTTLFPWKSMAQSDKLNISFSRAPNIPLSMDPPGLVHLPTSWSLKNQPLAWIRQIYELESMDRVHGTLRINNPMFPCFLFVAFFRDPMCF